MGKLCTRLDNTAREDSVFFLCLPGFSGGESTDIASSRLPSSRRSEARVMRASIGSLSSFKAEGIFS